MAGDGGRVPDVSEQRADHEAGIDLLRIRVALLEWAPERAREFILDLTARRLWPLARVSPSRDGTVAVEDVEKLAKTLYDVGAWLSSGDFAGWEVVVREIEGVLAEFGSARAGESNEGGNQ